MYVKYILYSVEIIYCRLMSNARATSPDVGYTKATGDISRSFPLSEWKIKFKYVPNPMKKNILETFESEILLTIANN